MWWRVIHESSFILGDEGRLLWGGVQAGKWKMKVAQSCLTFCDPMDYTVHGILQARILKWVAFHFSRGSSQPRDQMQVSHIAAGFFTSWATREAQEYWSGWSIPSPGILLTQESNQGLLHCRRILYQLSYQGTWIIKMSHAYKNLGEDHSRLLFYLISIMMSV